MCFFSLFVMVRGANTKHNCFFKQIIGHDLSKKDICSLFLCKGFLEWSLFGPLGESNG